MLRRHKKLTVWLSALLLTALQLHGIMHLLGREKHEAGAADSSCAVCEHSLHQQSLAAPEAVRIDEASLGFFVEQVSIVSTTPQFRGFSPSLRAPPAVS